MSGASASDVVGASIELQHERPELKIFTWAHEEIAADALSITGGHAVPAYYVMQAGCVHVQCCSTCVTLSPLISVVSQTMRCTVCNLSRCTLLAPRACTASELFL